MKNVLFFKIRQIERFDSPGSVSYKKLNYRYLFWYFGFKKISRILTGKFFEGKVKG